MSSWYYAAGNERQGPCEEHELQGLVQRGVIGPDTLVWAQGMADWKPAREVGAVSSHFSSPAPQGYASAPLARPPAGGPSYGTPAYGAAPTPNYQPPAPGPTYPPAHYAQQKQGLQGAFTTYLICLYAGIPLAFIGIGFLLILAALIIHFVLIHRLWSVIQDSPGEARTTPGKAVGFLFIPFFNLYWIFQAYMGLATDMNNYAARRGIPATNQEGMALTGAILTFVASPITYFIVWPMLINNLRKDAWRILDWKMQGGASGQHPQAGYAHY